MPFVELLGNFDEGLDQQVPFGTGVWIGHSLSSEPEDGSALSPARQIEVLASIERWYLYLGPQSGLAVGDRELQDQVLAISFEKRMGFDMDEAVGVSSRAAVGTRLPFSLKSHAHLIIDASRDFDFEFDLMRPQTVSIAGRAWVADCLATASADWASGLHSEHTGGLDDLAAALAFAAGLGLGSFGGPRSFAFFARRVSG